MVRYSVIPRKNPREIVMLRGRGCAWRRCRFCDYHLDFSRDEAANFALNRQVLSQVTGRYGVLEVINSGSFVDLDERTLAQIAQLCRQRGIGQIHFECHWMHRDRVADFRAMWRAMGVALKVKIGVETFDALFRESYLVKGIDETDPARIAQDFDEVCLLQGLPGQTVPGMIDDIQTGLAHFERVCVNIMNANTSPIRPDPRVIDLFRREVYPRYADADRVDILMENTDFGVGEVDGDAQ
ncbi:MAG: radical SAM protein [Christensenellales bacterium]